jgi:tRNA1Val (adenine37-N6)-methyltransferase
MKALTTDTFLDGRIQVKQSRKGYRFSIDTVIIASHAKPFPNDRIVDLGTGCGIIPLILACRYPDITVYGIEVQKELAEIAALNVEENGMKDRITVLCMDMKLLKHNMISGPANLVVSNPPYRRTESGRINPDSQRAIARHEIKVALSDVVKTASRMLQKSGRFVTVYPAERMTDLLMQMRLADIEPKFTRMIHSKRQTGAKLILVEGRKGGGPGIKVGLPLIIYRKDGSYSGEVQKMFMP